MSFIPYLHFDGTCAEAMAFYCDVFGGDLEMMRYRESPDAVPDWKDSDRIIHAQLDYDGDVLMASDYPPGHGHAQAGVSVMHTAASPARGQQLYQLLAEEGDVIMPWGPTFFSAGFGMVKDRFGTHWMIGARPDSD